jgi:hypothetical protein
MPGAPMSLLQPRIAVAMILVVATTGAQAARPMVVDEQFLRQSGTTLGSASLPVDDPTSSSYSRTVQMHGKTLFRTLETNSYSYGRAVGSVRVWVVPNRVQIDATIGTQGGDYGANRWLSIGMRLLTPPFLK